MNEDQYYNPIIQAMIHTAQLQKQGQQQEIEKQKNADELKMREAAMKQAQGQFEENHKLQLQSHELAKRHVDLLQQQADLQAEVERVKMLGEAQKFRASGGDASQLPWMRKLMAANQDFVGKQQGSQPAQDLPFVPNALPKEVESAVAPQIDINKALFNPDVAAESKGALVKAEESAKEPFRIAEDDRKFKSASDLLGIHSKYDLVHLEKQQQGLKEIAEINGRYHLLGSAALRRAGDLADADTVKQVVDGLYNATVDWTKLPKELKDSVIKYAGAIGEASTLPTDYKKQSARITSLSNIEPIMSHLEDLAQNYSRDSPGAIGKGNLEFGIGLPGIPLGTVGGVPGGSDLASRQGTLSGFLGQFAAFFDNWPGRKSNQEIERMKQGAFDPKATMAQNKKKIEEHAKLMKSAVQDMIAGMKPERAKQLLLEHNLDPDKYLGQGSDTPDFLKNAAPTNKNGWKLNVELSKKQGHAAYTQ